MARILVVDDEEPVRTVLTRQLRKWGHEVAPAANATEALESMAIVTPQIVFCDVIMPVHDGLWLLERIHARWPHVVVIMVSGALEINTVKGARALGALDYVAKPIGREMLHQALQRALAAVESQPPG
jgi:DNA-binding NtrC family response regulator